MLAQVKVLEDSKSLHHNDGKTMMVDMNLFSKTHLGGNPWKIDWRRCVLPRPEAGGEHPDREVHSSKLGRIGEVGLELVIDGVGQRHILEHPLQLRGELTTAL